MLEAMMKRWRIVLGSMCARSWSRSLIGDQKFVKEKMASLELLMLASARR